MIDPSLLVLLVVLGALAVAPAVLRRRRSAAPDAVRVVGRTALHKNAVVAVVAVGDRRLLVGTGERGVQLLAELDDADDGASFGHPPLGPLGMTFTSTTTEAADRMDAAGTTFHSTSSSEAPDAPDALDLDVGATTTGPGTGLVDRLREMTVRTPVPGRPPRVPLRR